jgi:hypothetical protein
MITVLLPQTPLVYLYSAFPLLVSRFRRDMTFTSDPSFVLERDKNRTLIIIRWFSFGNVLAPADPKAFLLRLRERYDRIVYFDDGDSTTTDLLHLLPLVDLFLRKQVFKDRSLYLRSHKGNRIFAEYAIERLGVPDENDPPYPVAVSREQLDKLRPAWHLGIGLYPLSHWKEKLAVSTSPMFRKSMVRALVRKPVKPSIRTPKLPICQARFTSKGYAHSIGFQRELFLQRVASNPRFTSGFLEKKQYLSEMKQAAAVLSPFGWGEVCYRDFEACLVGAVLIKPKMDHLLTWPDSYRPWETYAPVEWDASDLDSAVSRVLDSPALIDRMRENAWESWESAFDSLDERVEQVLNWCLGEKK